MQRIFFIYRYIYIYISAYLNRALSCRLFCVGEPCLCGALFVVKGAVNARPWSQQVFAWPCQTGSGDGADWAKQVMGTGHGCWHPRFHLLTPSIRGLWVCAEPEAMSQGHLQLDTINVQNHVVSPSFCPFPSTVGLSKWSSTYTVPCLFHNRSSKTKSLDDKFQK